MDYDSPLAPPEALGECVVTSRNAAGALNTFLVPFQNWGVKTGTSAGEPHIMVTVHELPGQVTQFVPFAVRVSVTNLTEHPQRLLVRTCMDAARCAHTYTPQGAAPTSATPRPARSTTLARVGRVGGGDECRRSASAASFAEKVGGQDTEGCLACDVPVEGEGHARVAPGMAVSELSPSFLSVAPKQSASLSMTVVPLLAGVQNLTGAQSLVVEERESRTCFTFDKLAQVVVTPQEGWSDGDDGERGADCKMEDGGAKTRKSEDETQEEPERNGEKDNKGEENESKDNKGEKNESKENKGEKNESKENKGEKNENEGDKEENEDKENTGEENERKESKEENENEGSKEAENKENAVSVTLPVASSPLSRSAIIDDSSL